MNATVKETGKIKFFNKTKGFGFIKPTDGSADLFFHVTTIKGTEPQENDSVEYNIGEGKKGECAVDVEVV